MAIDRTRCANLAGEIFDSWKDACVSADLDRLDSPVRQLLDHADTHILKKEWDNAREACQSALAIIESAKPLLSVDNGIQQGFSRSVVTMYLGIACVGVGDLNQAKENFRMSAKNFELARFPLDASVAYLSLGRVFRLEGDEMTACAEFNNARDSLDLGFFLPLDPEIGTRKQNLEKCISRQLNVIGCEMVDQPVPTVSVQKTSDPQASWSAVRKPSQTPTRVELGVLPVSQSSVSAGEPLVLLDEIADYAATDGIMLNGVAHGLSRFDGKRVAFQFRPGYEYRAVPVEGDSMNKLFSPSDFALLMLPRSSSLYPRPGDIVAVQIKSGELDELMFAATLKEYRPLDNGDVELRPLTTNTEKHKSKVYSSSAIQVRAIAVGVLRRLA